MQLIIMRHGQAESIASSDAKRNLTDTGRRDIAAMSARLVTRITPPTHLIYSPYNRTTQTADIVAEHFANTEFVDKNTCVLADDGIVAGVSLQSAVKWLEQKLETSNPAEQSLSFMIVSHQPLVSQLVGWLVHGAEGHALAHYPDVAMSPGSVAVLELDIVAKGAVQLSAMFHVS